MDAAPIAIVAFSVAVALVVVAALVAAGVWTGARIERGRARAEFELKDSDRWERVERISENCRNPGTDTPLF